MSKEKEKAIVRWKGRRGTVTIKSNPMPAGWVTHRLENNIKEFLPLL